MKNIAIIVGAGLGQRFGSFKQVEIINNKPVYLYSVDAFINTNSFSSIIVVVPKELTKTVSKDLADDRYKNVIVCDGGNSRSQSVYNAFKNYGFCR